jgi:hypothetical protein
MKTSLMQKIAKDLEKATDKPVTKTEGSGKLGKDFEAVADKPAKKSDTKVTAKDDKASEHKTDKSRKAEDNGLVAAIKKSLQYRMNQLKEVGGDVVDSTHDVEHSVSDFGSKVKDEAKEVGRKISDFVHKQASIAGFKNGYVSSFNGKDAFLTGYLTKNASPAKSPTLPEAVAMYLLSQRTGK